MHIATVVAELAHAQDSRDWEKMRNLFAETVHLDFSTVFGGQPLDTSANEVSEMARSALEGFAATHHATSNLLIECHGDTALCRAHVVSYHHLPTDPGIADFCTMRGYWELELRRIESRWRIRRWTIARTTPWEGYPGLYGLASARSRR